MGHHHKNINRRTFLGQASCAAMGMTTLFSTFTNLKACKEQNRLYLEEDLMPWIPYYKIYGNNSTTSSKIEGDEIAVFVQRLSNSEKINLDHVQEGQ